MKTAAATTAVTTGHRLVGDDADFDVVLATADFDAFARDPQGFGDYDWAEEITLVEFSCGRALHSIHAVPIV